MKYLILILLFSSCYTKQRAINKFCKNDTIQTTITIHDTIIIDSIQVDTVFSDTIDSVYMFKDKIEIRYVKKFGKIYLEGKCKGDTIFYEKMVNIYVPVKCPELSNFNKIFLEAKWWLLIVLGILLLVIFKK